ncbi:MAG TPA: hypothetical protein VNO23_15230 [Candidatus Binatia bacterium]|nr:hypothetical protein [Candidatus Binatia bacterium]
MIGGAALAIWFDVAPADRAELDAWYARQHLPERLSVPGFLRGRRYAATGGGTGFFTLYEVRDHGVLSSAAYLERLNNPTDWTRKVLPTFRGMVRTIYERVAAGPADAVADHLLTVRVEPGPGRGEAIRRWLEGEAPAALAALAGATAWGAYASEGGGTSVITEERRLVGDVRPGPPLLVLVEVGDPTAEAALRDFWVSWGRRQGATTGVDLYRLLYGLAWIAPRS